MPLMKFANVLLEHSTRAVNYPSLYCRSTKPVVFLPDSDAWELNGEGEFDFSTYFNALSINKLNTYTNAQKYYLHLELKGASCEVVQTTSDRFSSCPIVLDATKRCIEQSDSFVVLDTELVTSSDTILAGFIIRTTGPVQIRNSYYSVMTDQPLKDVELVLATTTDRKSTRLNSSTSLSRMAASLTG